MRSSGVGSVLVETLAEASPNGCCSPTTTREGLAAARERREPVFQGA